MEEEHQFQLALNKKLTRNFPLRGGKGSMYEGGLRVPFVIKGPGVSRNSPILMYQ